MISDYIKNSKDFEERLKEYIDATKELETIYQKIKPIKDRRDEVYQESFASAKSLFEIYKNYRETKWRVGTLFADELIGPPIGINYIVTEGNDVEYYPKIREHPNLGSGEFFMDT